MVCGQTPASKAPKQTCLPAQPLSEEHMGPQVTAWFHPPHVCSVVHVPVTCVHPAHLDPLTSWPSFYILKAICAGETGRVDSVLGGLHKEAWWRYSFVGGQRRAFLFPACLHSLYPHFSGRRFYIFLSIYRASQVVEWLKKKKKSICLCRKHKRLRFNPWVGKIPWSRKWQPAPVFLPGKFHGQRSLASSTGS